MMVWILWRRILVYALITVISVLLLTVTGKAKGDAVSRWSPPASSLLQGYLKWCLFRYRLQSKDLEKLPLQRALSCLREEYVKTAWQQNVMVHQNIGTTLDGDSNGHCFLVASCLFQLLACFPFHLHVCSWRRCCLSWKAPMSRDVLWGSAVISSCPVTSSSSSSSSDVASVINRAPIIPPAIDRINSTSWLTVVDLEIIYIHNAWKRRFLIWQEKGSTYAWTLFNIC